MNPPGHTTHHAAGGCMQPILIRGSIDHLDPGTGELLHRYTTADEPGGVLPIACKTRRASRCLPCAETYRYDTYQLIRAGLTGGKGIPPTVATHPAIFLTLTAPSFGPVHTRRERDGRLLRCRPRRNSAPCPHARPLSCPHRHELTDAQLGQPLCADCYDYAGTVLFNATAPELWRRFTISLRRALAHQAGLTVKAFPAHARVSFAKVAEYQRRGVVHFHAVIRIDGPHGPTTSPPEWATTTLLASAIDQAADAVRVQLPATTATTVQTLTWGHEHDIRPITTTTTDLTDGKVAAYLAKYATKAAECTGTPDRPITAPGQLADPSMPDHTRRLITTCLHLGKLPELEHLRLTAWAHMLGFRGHFSTKSRAYSTTLTALRTDRAHHQRNQAIAAGLIPPITDDTTLILRDWTYAGRGQPIPLPDLQQRSSA